MPFTWVYPANVGDYAQSEEVQEIRNNINTLATSILLPTPPSVESVSFIQPLADGVVIDDLAGDELQINLDTLKSENYCRGHHNARHISNNASDRVAIHSLECTDLATGSNVSDNATYNISLHSNYRITNNANKNGTRFGTYHANYDNGD